MALSNLGELKTSIADWINREDLTTVIPDFVKLGVARINADHRSDVAETELVQDITLASEAAQNPITTDADLPLSIYYNGKELAHVTWDKYQQELDTQSYLNGCWTIREGEIHISKLAEETAATPASGGDSTSIRVYGLNKSSDFDYADDTSTTPFFLKQPGIYLFAALVETSIYLRDMEGMTVYQARYNELLDKAHKEYKRSKVSGGFSVVNVGGDNSFSRDHV